MCIRDRETNLSQWDPPVAERSLGVNDSLQELHRDTNSQQAVPAPDANHLTGVEVSTPWQVPPLPIHRSEAGSSALLDGWKKAIDSSTGNAYYYHSEKNLSQWDLPVTERSLGVDDNLQELHRVTNSQQATPTPATPCQVPPLPIHRSEAGNTALLDAVIHLSEPTRRNAS